ncbi:hypothetical protein CC86DRAFT_376192 [Ophiobolus disseminans]|uniref:Uncharacterized protein n=1 Tax=Ophiobolus disseminans TaxID=1469910 RepID=A0A6A7AK15_9PLEO|nr:hypothetical protein CC86DRAFT_376192 [Ophiobolus disseminans]
MSQTNIATTNFLELCISKKRTIQDITEALGLDSETADARKEPIFIKDEANGLHKKIKEYADACKAIYRNERETMLIDLVKDGVFAAEVQELGETYGQKLWGGADSWPTMYGRQHSVFPQELSWDKEADQHTIRYYLRCWITRHAVQPTMSRRGKGRANAVPRELSDSEHSDVEHLAQRSTSTALPDLPFRAPEATDMLPPAEITRMDTAPTQTRLVDNEGNLDIALGSEARSPKTPNTKRKAISFHGQLSSGKLPKLGRDARTTITSPRGRQRDIYSIPLSPAPHFPVRLGDSTSTSRMQREDTCDSDSTYKPPHRQGTVGSETEIDPDEVMADTQELFSIVQVTSDGETPHDHRSPTAGPSGTYPDPQRQDSVIPPSTQHGADNLDNTQFSPHRPQAFNTNTDPWRTALLSTLHIDVSKIDPWQGKQLRMQLFKLLLSYLNNINEFAPEAYQPDAEERMNNLLYQFWINDAESLRTKVGNQFDALQASLERWMNMRHLLAEFQRKTGYFGKPGDGWKEYLRRMDRVAHARSSIAYVGMKGCVGVVGEGVEAFDDELVTVFDLLTQVEGCNGVEEFEAVRGFNEGLLEWFV